MPAHARRVRLADERNEARERGVDDGRGVSRRESRREPVVRRIEVLVGAVLEDDRRGAHGRDERTLGHRRWSRLVRPLDVVVVVVVVAVVSVLGDELDLRALLQGRLVELIEAVEERRPVVEVALLLVWLGGFKVGKEKT